MKMVKKILLGLTAAAAVIAFAGCKPITNNNAKVSGPKTNKKVEIDASDVSSGYKRAFGQLGTLEQLYEIKTKISFTKAAVNNNSVVGFAFDLNFDKNAQNQDISDSYNFVLIGIRPDTNQFYLERYKQVSMSQNNGVVTAASLGSYISNTSGGSTWSTSYGEHDDWRTLTDQMYTLENGVMSITVDVSQDTDKSYVIKLGTATIGTYSRNSTDGNENINLRTSDPGTGKAQGGVAYYANACPGARFEVRYETNSSDAHGSWNAEEFEEELGY